MTMALGFVRKKKRRSIWNTTPRQFLSFYSIAAGFLFSFAQGQGVGYGKIVPIPAGGRVQYQRLNYTGPNTYKFGYDTGTGPSQSFREEERDISGTVRGRYGFINPLGALHIVEYYADDTGFHIIEVLNLEPERKPPLSTTTTTTTTTTPAPDVDLNPLPPFSGPLPPFVRRPQRPRRQRS